MQFLNKSISEILLDSQSERKTTLFRPLLLCLPRNYFLHRRLFVRFNKVQLVSHDTSVLIQLAYFKYPVGENLLFSRVGKCTYGLF